VAPALGKLPVQLLETTLANALFSLDAVLPDRLLTHHNPPHGLVYIASRLKACDVSDRQQLCPTYPLELQSFHVRHTFCITGPYSGWADRGGDPVCL
jgi:hypothetical protein